MFLIFDFQNLIFVISYIFLTFFLCDNFLFSVSMQRYDIHFVNQRLNESTWKIIIKLIYADILNTVSLICDYRKSDSEFTRNNSKKSKQKTSFFSNVKNKWISLYKTTNFEEIHFCCYEMLQLKSKVRSFERLSIWFSFKDFRCNFQHLHIFTSIVNSSRQFVIKSDKQHFINDSI